MKIAYVSEDAGSLRLVGEYLHRYYDKNLPNAEICLFNDPEALVNSLEEDVYALILLDATFRENSGVSVIYRIRRFVPDVAVVLLRFLENGRAECFFVNPTKYVLEEFSPKSFSALLDSVRGLLYGESQCTVRITTVQNLDRIVPMTEITYAESRGHRVYVHLTNGEELEAPGPLKVLGERLAGYTEFLFPHRSFIVNAFYVSCIFPDALYLRTPPVKIPIARGKLGSIRQAYADYFRMFGRETNLQTGHTQPPASV